MPLPKLIIAAALLPDCFYGGIAAAAENHADSSSSEWSALAQRRSLGFDRITFERLIEALRNLPHETPQLIQFARRQHQIMGHGSALIVLLAIAIAYALFCRARLARRFLDALVPLSRRIPGSAREWLAAVCEILAAVLLPTLLWLLWSAVRAITAFDGPMFVIAGQLLSAWALYSLGISVLYALLKRPLLPMSTSYNGYLLGFARLLIAYAIAVRICTNLMSHFGAPGDVAALVAAALRLWLILMLAAVTLRRRAVLALFPDIPNSLYSWFVGAFSKLYPFIWIFTIAVAFAQLAGFSVLADFLWERTWLPVGIFLAAVVINYLCQQALRSRFEDSVSAENAADLHRSVSRLVRYAVVLTAIALFSHLLGGVHPLYALLAQPVTTLGDKSVSVLVLLKAVLIVMIFGLAARLIRDYCEFRVYPRNNIDPGVANAINTFIIYSIVAIGILASVEAVGLGLGTITLFAGALGIGIGMGLQSMANNLTSGFTLIFTRALRKGDVVTTGETIGVIQEVGIRATRMKTFDAIEYLVPNSEFVDGKIINWTRSDPFTRVHIPIGVSYDAAPEEVRQIMEQVASATPNVQPAPCPEVRFVGLGDSSLNFELLLWINVKNVQPERVRSDLYFGLFRALKQAGIEIPFPQRDIHIRSPAELWLANRPPLTSLDSKNDPSGLGKGKPSTNDRLSSS